MPMAYHFAVIWLLDVAFMRAMAFHTFRLALMSFVVGTGIVGTLSTVGSMSTVAWAAPAANGASVDFQREIRPLLSDNCFHCHGPDASTRMVGLRLDLQDEALKSRKNGATIVPGDSEASLLYKRIAEPKPARRMPPPSAHKVLTEEQIALFKRWIDQGAKWEEHWAWQAPVKPNAPAVKDVAWVKGEIDRFVLAKLESKGLRPAAEADRRTLVRRVALDLTGLPPKPVEITQFLEDKAPGAYERMVDRYLASPHYGEHRGRYWLDAARYGDTHGIHIDNYREIWPYRDWVIQAFNRNMPFDQFSTEQLAGDMLPNPTMEQRIATGFQRCNVTTNEAGIIEKEYEEIYAKDRADTVGAVWLGMTVGCATCHDHKFDPIKASDFYALGAFFRNTTQRVYDENVYDTPPILIVPQVKDRKRWIAVQDRLGAIRSAIADLNEKTPAGLDAWASSAEAAKPSPIPEEKVAFVAEPFRVVVGQERVSLGAGALDGQQAVYFPKDDNKGLELQDLPKQRANEAFSFSLQFLTPDKRDSSYNLVSRRQRESGNRGWSLSLQDRVIIFNITGGASDAIEFRTDRQLIMENGVWNHITVSYDGSRSQEGIRLYLNGKERLLLGRKVDPVKLRGDFDISDPVVLGATLNEGAIADFRMFKYAVTEADARLLSAWPRVELALAVEPAQRTDEQKKDLLPWYLHSQDANYQSLVAEQIKLDKEAREIAARGVLTHVMQERTDQTPFAHVLFRGAYDQPRERVAAATPSVLPPMPANIPHNRLGLAQWLFLPQNPMTARVTVNRMWQEVFGAGIVRTADDFGSQGEPPVNQPLLDWLAIDFRESNWDVKRFYRQVLLSATYRQAAVATPQKIEIDPQNRLLSRGPRFRMDGEMVRDSALAASGLLAPRIGGPSVKPYQPEGIWEDVAMYDSNTRFYKEDTGEGLYRRSMYTFWKRSAPPASMEIFNAPSRENCVVLRERTNTPLQALVTMNDPQFFESARVLAGRAMSNYAHFGERLGYISEQLLARPLTAAEQAIAEGAFSDYRSHYNAHPDDASAMLAQGRSAPDPSLPVGEFAAYTMLTNQLMNLDEVLNK